MKSTVEVVGATLEKCRLVAAGADELMPRVGPVLKQPPETLASLHVDDRSACLAYLKRYEQLQDMLGRLGRAVASWEAIDAREMTARDLANLLERWQLVSDADWWMDAARLRNKLVHEYPIEEEEQIARLLEAAAAMPSLQRMVSGFAEYLRQRGFPL